MKRLYFFLLLAILSQQTIISQWVQTNGPYGGFVSTIFINGTNIFAGTGSDMGGCGGIFRSTNNGGTWTAVNSGLPTRDACVEVIASSGDGQYLFAGIPGAGIFRSSDNGLSWTEVNTGLPDNKLVTSFASYGNNLFLSLFSGGVFHSTDNGTSWNSANSGLPQVTYAVSLVVSGTDIFVGTLHYGVFLSTNNGTSWTPVNSDRKS